MKVQDLVFYMIGSGEYDELMRAHPFDTPERWPMLHACCQYGSICAGHACCPLRLAKVLKCPDSSCFGLQRSPAIFKHVSCSWLEFQHCCGIAVREALGAVAGCLAEALGRTPNEAAMFRDYGRAVLALDEVICEVGRVLQLGRAAT